ncbi:MbtH family protein [Frankia sp. CiP1_Cm_nod2]|uniref:MbtH family protein n=1 Tax=Frankia sp. CiP1_Cm_nod2 TaxID=2897161 RepID=UPI00202476E4
MTNPFEDPDGVYTVLVNAEGQYSLWPDFIDVPAGWTVEHGPGPRQECLDYIETVSYTHLTLPTILRV